MVYNLRMVRLSDPPAIVEFGNFRILPYRRQLIADGQPIALGGRAFDVLMALIEASGAVVGKDELLRLVWQGRIVDENRLAGAIVALRKAFGADRELIRTVAGRGYQFTGEIRVRSEGEREVPGNVATAAERPRASDSDRASLPSPDKPSIAVLPFHNMSGDPEQEYFADGMVEEIITALSRIRWLFVIARNSSFTYKGKSVDVKQVGRQLGVRYVLEGSVRKGGEPGTYHRAADRSRDRGASLGGSFRRLLGRCVRPPGQGGDQRRRDHRAGIASRRGPPLGGPSDE